MNWEAIGAVGEVVGAVAVIASIVYLARQIRQNTQAVRRASGRQTGEKNAVALRAIADYSDLFSGPFMGLDRAPNLDAVQRARFNMVLGLWMQAVEQTFADVREGLVEAEYAQPYRDHVRQILACQGGREWFSASFQREVDALISPPGE